ncbi:MAG: anaerobic ribonucleoside-triphosphate reductase, partial [Candidatus Thorarchaeota archaeon]
ELTKKIATDTLSSYWSFTKDVMWCGEGGYQAGVDWRNARFARVDDLRNLTCPKCGHHGIDIVSRITGYMQSLSSFNRAKRQEFLDRHRYTL